MVNMGAIRPRASTVTGSTFVYKVFDVPSHQEVETRIGEMSGWLKTHTALTEDTCGQLTIASNSKGIGYLLLASPATCSYMHMPTHIHT